jgi:NAD-dependent DNA ligase
VSPTLTKNFAGGLKIMGKTISDIPGIGPSTAEVMAKNGYKTVQQIAETTAEKLGGVPGFGMIRATRVIKLANEVLTAPVTATSPPAKTRARPKRATPKPAAAGETEKQDKKKDKKKGKKKDKKKGKSKKGKKK